jgi:glucose-1-phosphate thymidylyltransferase
VAGKPMVHRLVEEISSVCDEKIEEIAFIIGHFGNEVEQSLIKIAETFGAKGTIYYQEQPLGTAHAIYCAEPSLKGKVTIAFADTLFDAGFKMDSSSEAVIWVQQVKNPEQFGVVKVNKDNVITDFFEKPKNFISDLAIIGIYYFRDGENLKNELKYLLDNKVIVNGEYQLTDALENMKNKGLKFNPGQVKEWLDCGNKDATVYTNTRMLELKKNEKLISESAQIKNTVVIEPCFIGNNVVIENSVIGPHVSIGDNTIVKNSLVKDCIIQNNSKISNANIENSMVGNFVEYAEKSVELSIGDYNTIIRK